MNITVFGIGYVGLVTGACLAEIGHHVVCMDVDFEKVELLKSGKLPIWEPGLDAIVKRNVSEGRLLFTNNVLNAVQHGKVQFIAVGTPPDQDGSADLKYVLSVAEEIANNIERYTVIVIKSTVPVGTNEKVNKQLSKVLNNRKRKIKFDVVSNPEFLKEGSAVSDFMKPDRIIIGTRSLKAKSIMRELYEPFNRSNDRILYMGERSAELTKYAANAMLATKISFMNEIANISELMDADIEEVRKGIGSDPRIGYHFIYSGCGYGGSCFPKDVKALVQTSMEFGYKPKIIKAVEEVNNRQKKTLFNKLSDHFNGDDNLKGKTIAVWGLAFKPNTDDIREAPSRVLVESLIRKGVIVQAYDPVAMHEFERIYGKKVKLKLFQDMYSALQDANALVICTEWKQFRAPDFNKMGKIMKNKVIVDGRNMYNIQKLIEYGWIYKSIGRK
jgi:UDPglucose 6-dehydrogenase